MKLFVITLAMFAMTVAANAGTKNLSKRMLKTILKNHLVVAKVTQPGNGLKLFDTCHADGHMFSISQSPVSKCSEWGYEIDEDSKHDLYPKKIPVCLDFEYSVPSASTTKKGSKSKCKMVQGKDHPNEGLYGDKPFDFVSLCTKIPTSYEYSLVQTIEVYSLNNNFSDRIYWHSSHADHAQPGYSKYKYTIPACH